MRAVLVDNASVYIEDAIAKMASLLGLDHWQIVYKIVDEDDMPDVVSKSCVCANNFYTDERVATLWFRRSYDIHEGYPLYPIETLVAHELGHITLSRMTDLFDAVSDTLSRDSKSILKHDFADELESVIDAFAVAITAKVPVPYLSELPDAIPEGWRIDNADTTD